MTRSRRIESPPRVEALLQELKLPGWLSQYRVIARRASQEGWGFEKYLEVLAEIEIEERRGRRLQRLRKQSRIPLEKTLAGLEPDRFPLRIRRQLPVLCTGEFVRQGQNLLVFGLPGRGKTHLVCAIGHELLLREFRVLFSPAYQLVQRLLRARRDLSLETELRRLDSYDAVILDDLGYIQQDREEMEVLFTFLSDRYERKSVLLTSNLVFSQWSRIFKDPMTTAAAIDRVVHHAIILELNGPSYRAEAAARAQQQEVSPEEMSPPDPRPESLVSQTLEDAMAHPNPSGEE